MSNELRDPHDPVVPYKPGESNHPPEGHGGVSMPIGQSNPDFDPHEPVLPDGMKQTEVPHVEAVPTLPSAADLDAVEAEKDIADSTAKAEGAKGRVSRRS